MTRSRKPSTRRRYVAFLRAVNVGGRTIKMADLRRVFESLTLTGVETFIASGNVIFDSAAAEPATLENQIERRLRDSFGYEVATFLRSTSELAAIASYKPFAMSEGDALYIAFLSAPPSTEAVEKLMSLQTDLDQFHSHDREIYWFRRGNFRGSPFSGPMLEKTLGMPATVRNSTTVNKLAAKYPPGAKDE